MMQEFLIMMLKTSSLRLAFLRLLTDNNDYFSIDGELTKMHVNY